MAHAHDLGAPKITLLLVSLLVALGSGCGRDYSGGAEGGFGTALATRLVDRMGGPATELTTYTSCESIEEGGSRSRCAGVRSAGVEAFFDGRSLVFDFSNAPGEGVIAETGFEGYVLSLTEQSRLAAIMDAVIDQGESTVDSEALFIEIDDTSVSIDFEGLRYDDTTFIKIDLVFEGA